MDLARAKVIEMVPASGPERIDAKGMSMKVRAWYRVFTVAEPSGFSVAVAAPEGGEAGFYRPGE